METQSLRQVADGLAACHAESPEVRAAGGASLEDADTFESGLLRGELAAAGLPTDPETQTALRGEIRKALREMGAH